MFDVIVRGGRIIDPSQDLDTVADVGIRGPRIAAIGADLIKQGVRGEVVDACGLLVTPGWIDLHTHVYWGVAPLGVEADTHCVGRGVTTAVDAGSAGASTFPGFKRYVIDVSATRVVAMLNLSTIGMAADHGARPEAIGELEDIRWAAVDRAIEVARAYADVITGIKIRLSTSIVGQDAEHSREVLRRARQVADTIGKPVMVHQGGTAIPLDDILARLVRGDIVTHVYHGLAEGVLDQAGKVRPGVRAAVDRGVNFDVGHGAGSFTWRLPAPRWHRAWRRVPSARTSTSGTWPVPSTTWQRPPASCSTWACRCQKCCTASPPPLPPASDWPVNWARSHPERPATSAYSASFRANGHSATAREQKRPAARD